MRVGIKEQNITNKKARTFSSGFFTFILLRLLREQKYISFLVTIFHCQRQYL